MGADDRKWEGANAKYRWDILRGVRLCTSDHVYATYLPRCPWCPPIPKRKGA
jgi:hypothetical protein